MRLQRLEDRHDSMTDQQKYLTLTDPLQFRHMGWQKRTGDLAGRAKGLISEKLIRGGREGRGPDVTSHEGERFARQKKSVALPGARQIFESALLNTQ